MGAIPKEVVPLGTVAASASDQGAMPIYVDDVVAQWAPVLRREEENAQASLEHGHEQLRGNLAVAIFGRGRMQPPTCVRRRNEAEVRFIKKRSRGSVFEGREQLTIDVARQNLLPEWLIGRTGDNMRRGNESVVAFIARIESEPTVTRSHTKCGSSWRHSGWQELDEARNAAGTLETILRRPKPPCLVANIIYIYKYIYIYIYVR